LSSFHLIFILFTSLKPQTAIASQPQLTGDQKIMLQEFIAFTKLDGNIALQILMRADWKQGPAVALYEQYKSQMTQ
jgi:hypothetical protein